MIPAHLDPLLRPLEQFESVRRRVVHCRVCDLSFANPYNGVMDQVRGVIGRALARDRLLDLQYAPFGGQTLARRAVADDLRRRCGIPFTFEDIILTPGAMAALHVALRLAGEAGDEVIIPVPCWLDYPLYAKHMGLTAVLVPLQEPTFKLDIEAIARRLTKRTCAVMFSNPSNPAGQCYGPEVLRQLSEALEEAARRTGRLITLISDEAHRDFAPPGGHRSTAAEWPATLTVYSFGKYHFIQGQRCGYLAVSPHDPRHASLRSEAVRWTRILGICTPTALMQSAVPGLLALQHNHVEVAAQRCRMTVELSEAGYRVVPAEATLFLYVATPGEQDDFEFINRLADAGALALPAPLFHHQGYFRLSLTAGSCMFEGGLNALRRAMTS